MNQKRQKGIIPLGKIEIVNYRPKYTETEGENVSEVRDR